MTVIRIPATTPEATPPVHWNLAARANHPGGFACGKPTSSGRYGYDSALTTCPDCIAVVVRRHCNAIEPGPGPLPARCGMEPHEDGPHDWERDTVPQPDPRREQVQRLAAESYAVSAEYDMLTRRAAEESQHPALVDAGAAVSAWESDGGPEGPRDAAGPSGRLPWPRIARWVV